jgi:histone-lysine N-methyltransferase SETMAR
MKCNSQYFCQDVIPDLQQNIRSSSCRTTLKGLLLHLDNALAHNLRLSSEKIESAKAQRVPHSPYDPDLAPSDFFLFGYQKEN